MNMLALETSGNFCSVALYHNAQMYQKSIEALQKQGDLLLPMVQEALMSTGLTHHDIDVIAFDAGPGSFTGVRLGTAVTQGLGMGWGKSLMPICSLQALAYKIFQEKELNSVAVCLDARKQEIYVGGYQFQADAIHVVLAEQVIVPSQLTTSLEVHGPLSAPFATDILRFAQYLLKIGYKPCSPSQVEPIYLRNKVTD